MAKRKSRRSTGNVGLLILVILIVAAIVLVVIYKHKGMEILPSDSASQTSEMSSAVTDGKSIKVEVLDVGQGDSILITSEDGKYILIDAGTASCKDDLIGYLDSRNVNTLEYMVLTHPDADHIGSAKAVLEKCEVKNVITPDYVHDTKTYKDVEAAIDAEAGINRIVGEAGKSFSLDNMKFDMLAPNSEKYSDVNNYSVVLRMQYGSQRFLFMGDAEAKSEKEILDNGTDISAEWLKVSHHGSSTSTTERFLKAVKPKIAAISCGAGNKYGHPHSEVLERLKGTLVFRTDIGGSLVFVCDGQSITTPDR